MKKTLDEIIVVKLFKQLSSYNEIFTETKEEEYPFDAFGYYDRIVFSKVSNANDLEKLTRLPETGVEQTILIPAGEESLLFEKRAIGCISFILVDSQGQNQFFDIARKIQDYIQKKLPNDKQSAQVFTYVTMGASAIALIAFCHEASFVQELTDYLHALQNYSWMNHSEIIYTFSIPFVDTDTFIANEKNQQITNTERLDSVHISFLWKTQCLQRVNQFISSLEAALKPAVVTKGLLSGTDDYFIYANDVSAQQLIELFSRDGMLSSIKNHKLWYGDICHSSQTMFGFEWNNMVTGTPYTLQNTKATGAAGLKHERQQKILIELENEVAKEKRLQKYIKDFGSLKDSVITKWVYQHYFSIIELYAELLKKGRVDSAGTRDLWKEEAYYFFEQFNKMLEALLRTSAYFTDCPGYQTTENNCLPRLLLCYQRIINDSIRLWDESNIKAHLRNIQNGRKHIFFLYAREELTVQARMFYRYLPPDRRLIGISVPIHQAYHPSTVIPLMLHEAGHYVGVRHRNSETDSRYECFIRLSINRFFEHILERMYKDGICGAIHIVHSINQNNYQEGEKASHLLATLCEINEEFTKDVLTLYQKLRRERVDNLKAIEEESTSRERYAVEENYFSEMSALVESVFYLIMTEQTTNIQGALNRHLSECAQRTPIRKYEFIQYEMELNERLNDALKQVAKSLDNAKRLNFVRESESMLSEVAADIFMIRICNMSEMEYIILVFEQYVNNNSDWFHMINSVFSTPAAYVRLLSIVRVFREVMQGQLKSRRTLPQLEPMNSEFTLEQQKLDQELTAFENVRLASMKTMYCNNSFEEEQLQKSYISFKEKIEEHYKKMCASKKHDWFHFVEELAHPFDLVSNYAVQLAKDERYISWNADLREHMNRVRNIYEISRKAEEDGTGFVQVYRSLYELDD